MTPDLKANLTHPAAVVRFVGTCAVGLGLDLFTKAWAFRALATSIDRDPAGHVRVISDEYPFIPGWLHFEVTANQGAVFGIGQGQRLLFVVVSIFAIGLLTYLFATGSKRAIPQLVLGMLLAGVLGNMYDRVGYGYVRDMIHALPGWLNPLRGMFPSWNYVFPWIFNVADIMLCTGVGLTLVLGLFQRRPETDSASTPASANERTA